VRTKSQLGWLNLPQSPTLPPPVIAKWQRGWVHPPQFTKIKNRVFSSILRQTDFMQNIKELMKTTNALRFFKVQHCFIIAMTFICQQVQQCII